MDLACPGEKGFWAALQFVALRRRTAFSQPGFAACEFRRHKWVLATLYCRFCSTSARSMPAKCSSSRGRDAPR
jgi:hypothetical protein